MSCLFYTTARQTTLPPEENKNVFCHANPDSFPVTKGHQHIIPRNHVPDFFDLQELERHAIFVLLEKKKEDIGLLDNTVSRF